MYPGTLGLISGTVSISPWLRVAGADSLPTVSSQRGPCGSLKMGCSSLKWRKFPSQATCCSGSSSAWSSQVASLNCHQQIPSHVHSSSHTLTHSHTKPYSRPAHSYVQNLCMTSNFLLGVKLTFSFVRTFKVRVTTMFFTMHT